MPWLRVFLILAVAMTAVGAVTDWRKGIIPNWITLVPLGLAPLLHAIAGVVTFDLAGAGRGLAYSVLGAVVCGIVPLVLYRMGAILGGDVKLLIALGAVCRPMIGLEAMFYAFVVAALYAPARLAFEGKLLRTLINSCRLAINPFLPKERRVEITPEMMTSMRFGPSAFVGTCIVAFLHWRG